MKRSMMYAICILFSLSVFSGCGREGNEMQSKEKMNSSIASEDTQQESNNAEEKTLGKKVVPDTTRSVKTKESVMQKKQEETTESSVTSYVLDTPTFSYYQSNPDTSQNEASLNLVLQSSEKNKIIDEKQWVMSNHLSLNIYDVGSYSQIPGEVLPSEIGSRYANLILTKAFYDDSYIYCTYGSDYSEGYILNIYDKATNILKYSLDFSNYEYAPEYNKQDYEFVKQRVVWASLKNNILYVSHGHSTYAASSNYENAYITAIDITNYSILWNSEPLVCNTNNFIIYGNYILCGYGFTDEKDYLYQISLDSGKILDQEKLKTAPEYLALQDDKLYVRCYDMDYVYSGFETDE